MDARHETAADDPVIVSGLGCEVPEAGQVCDPLPYLKVKKLRKFMGVQDDLAVVAAARALESAGLAGVALGERAGLYLVVGPIPFEKADLDPLLEASVEDGEFSMRRFSTAGFKAVNGLLTFRCLPNMPAFHVSVNFDIQGPYFVSYPGPGQFYLALEQAKIALEEGDIDVALVGGVAHSRNFLSAWHHSRLKPPVHEDSLRDAAGFLVLERGQQLRQRRGMQRGWHFSSSIEYCVHGPERGRGEPRESISFCPKDSRKLSDEAVSEEMGPASLPVLLARAEARQSLVFHSVETRDGFRGSSFWGLS
jgi:hypothetical protein